MSELISIKRQFQKTNNQYLLYWLRYFHRRLIVSFFIIYAITSLFVSLVLSSPLLSKTEQLLSHYEKIAIASIRFCIVMTVFQTILFYLWYVFNHRITAYKHLWWMFSLLLTSAFLTGLLLYLYAITGINLRGLLIVSLMLLVAAAVGWCCNYYFNDFIVPLSRITFYMRFVLLYVGYYLLQYVLDIWLALPNHVDHITSIELWITTPTFVLCSMLNSAKIFDSIQAKALTKLRVEQKKQIFYGGCALFCFSFTFFVPILLFQYFYFIFFDSRYLCNFILMSLFFMILVNICSLMRVFKKYVILK